MTRCRLSFRHRRLGGKTLLAAAICTSLPGVQAELYFNVNSLNLSEEQKKQIDLSLLSRVDIQMPGIYEVDVWINDRRAGDHRLRFVACEHRLCPEVTPALLKTFGIRTAGITALATLAPDAVLTDIERYIPDATADFDFTHSRLNLSIPQAALDNPARGAISSDKWQHGVPMLFTSYSASGAEVRGRGARDNASNQYVNLRSGANYGPWRLRNNSYYSHSESRGYQWSATQTWLERDIPQLTSRLVAGETSTPGMLFDSFSFRGLSLGSQDEMLPDSMQGFAPEVRGVAMTNATVEIRQNGHMLYQTFVPPGAFVINDLYAVSTSGDLEISVREENGDVRTSTQSFAAPPVSARKGTLKYTATLGEFGARYYQQRDAEPQKFAQAEFLYGALNNSSLYGGVIAAQHYRAGMLGVGQGMGNWGALSLDVTHADTDFADSSRQQGQSWRLRYSKRFERTGTNMTLAGYRYATDGYFNFDDASNSFHSSARNDRPSLRRQAQLTLSQNIGALGSVALTASQSEYWGHDANKSRAFTGSWSKSFGGVSVSLNQSQSKNWTSGRSDHITSANVSLPVGKWLSASSASTLRVSNSITYAERGNSSLNSTLSGTALEGNNLSYSLSQSHNRQSHGDTSNSTALSGTYQGGRATASLGYADYYGEQSRISWALRGAVVIHPYGVTLSQPLSEGSGYALVKAPGADGVSVKNQIGLTTDSRGYAVVPALAPYRENVIALDTATLGDDADLTDSIQHAVPTREALVLSDFETRIGHRVFLTLSRAGVPLPLGVTVSEGDNSSLTNEKGQLFMNGVPPNARLEAILPGGNRCHAEFDSRSAIKINGIMMVDLECV